MTGDNSTISQKDRERYRADLAETSLRAYRRLCLGMVVSAAVFLLLLVVLQLFFYADHHSISHYVHDDRAVSFAIPVPLFDPFEFRFDGLRVGDLFIGILCAVAVFLLLFRGLSPAEDLRLNLAGLCLFGVALVPTDVKPTASDAAAQAPGMWGPLERRTADLIETGLNLHIVFAVLFFLLIAIVAIRYSGDRVGYLKWAPSIAVYRTIFQISGAAMIFLPVLSIGAFLLSRSPDWVFWLEMAAIVPFGVFWFFKWREFNMILTRKELG